MDDVAPAKPRLAYLGPPGTYSHQTAFEHFQDNVEYVEQPNIKAVFDAISPEIPFGLVPQENTIYGAVIETYDALRHPSVGAQLFVKGEVTLGVQHCLIARKGVRFEDIQRIVSHEQALGQCSGFISTHFPDAVLEKRPSTAAAAQTLLEDDPRNQHSAAICSTICETLFQDLEILRRSVQDSNVNYTRFYVLSQALDAKPPAAHGGLQLRRALVRLSLKVPPPKDHEPSSDTEEDETATPAKSYRNRPTHLVMSTLLTTFGVSAIRIDRRPSCDPIPFEDTYFIELEDFGEPVEPLLNGYGVTDEAWVARVRQGIETINSGGGNASLLGVW